LDGEAPYDQADLVNQGLGEICNVNWGQAEQLLSMATAPYIDLLESVDTIITTPTKFGDPQLRAEWETIISEEFTRMIRNWLEFYPRYLYLVQQFLAHGVVVAYFDDDIDFRFQVSPLGDFLIPRQTRASDEEIEVACFVRSVPPHELYQKIEDEAVATEVGWNVPATKKAIVNAHQINLREDALYNWEKIQREFKNNDIGYSSSAMATEVKLVYMFVKELDGTVSQYIFCEDDQMVREYLASLQQLHLRHRHKRLLPQYPWHDLQGVQRDSSLESPALPILRWTDAQFDADDRTRERRRSARPFHPSLWPVHGEACERQDHQYRQSEFWIVCDSRPWRTQQLAPTAGRSVLYRGHLPSPEGTLQV
jgi:hypothetical protein